MKKIKLSISLETINYNQIMELANTRFYGSPSAALNWIIASMNQRKFYGFMAKYHASQMYHYKSVCDTMDELVQVRNQERADHERKNEALETVEVENDEGN